MMLAKERNQNLSGKPQKGRVDPNQMQSLRFVRVLKIIPAVELRGLKNPGIPKNLTGARKKIQPAGNRIAGKIVMKTRKRLSGEKELRKHLTKDFVKNHPGGPINPRQATGENRRRMVLPASISTLPMPVFVPVVRLMNSYRPV
jgi:hypothetical protein